MHDHTILTTRIPEGRTVEGLEYGAHYSAPDRSWSGYYVRAGTCPQWGIARLTPASDELEDTDAATVRAIAEELEGIHAAICEGARGEAMIYAKRHGGDGAEIVRQGIRDGIADQRVNDTVIPFADGTFLRVQGDGSWSTMSRDPRQPEPDRVSPDTRDSSLPPKVRGW